MNAILTALVIAGLILLASTAAPAAGKKVCRDAKTGTFVSAKYAKKYPGLTVCEIKTDMIKQKKQG